MDYDTEHIPFSQDGIHHCSCGLCFPTYPHLWEHAAEQKIMSDRREICSMTGTVPPRCPTHKTAMIVQAIVFGTVSLKCVLRECKETHTLPSAEYERIYGGPAKAPS